jgi:RNA polymerase sigma factor (sigma-70 family)
LANKKYFFQRKAKLKTPIPTTPVHYTDAELLDGCLRKDPKAQTTLYQQYKARLFGVCRRYARQKGDAEDIFQDAFVKVFTNMEQVREARNLSAWIRRVVVNMCVDYYRKQGDYCDFHEIEESFVPESNTESAISQLSNQELLTYISELPHGARVIFNLYVIDGYTHPEIAKLLNISEGTSKSQLFFAKNLLKIKLQKAGIEAN